MRIGELSARSGVSQRSLRYYEQQGLIEANRQSNGYRDYTEATVERAGTIHLLFGMGFPRDVVRSVLACAGPAATPAAHTDLYDRLEVVREEVDARVAQLSATRSRIDEFLSERRSERA
jgi:DNA-binding transcriptional MerR regulator